MMTAALVQVADPSKIPEMDETAAELTRRGLGVTRFHAKHLIRRRVKLSAEVLVVGEIHVVESALRQLGRSPPKENCYPQALEPFLLRKVWPSTMREVTRGLLSGTTRALFVKPRDRIKTFTGRMVDESDIGHLMHIGASTPVWCSDIVSFRSEHRAFVIDGQLKCIRQYAGETERPDAALMHTCIDTWTQTGSAARAYAIDFGVLRDGRTALLEVNDGYSLGTYGCPPEISVDVLVARWKELMDTR